MYHWYLLVDKIAHSPHRVCLGFADSDDGGGIIGLCRPNGVRMLVLGAVETIPLAGGVGLGFWFDPDKTYFGFLAAGLTLSLVLCWLLRHQVPPTVIHAVNETPGESQKLIPKVIGTE